MIADLTDVQLVAYKATTLVELSKASPRNKAGYTRLLKKIEVEMQKRRQEGALL